MATGYFSLNHLAVSSHSLPVHTLDLIHPLVPTEVGKASLLLQFHFCCCGNALPRLGLLVHTFDPTTRKAKTGRDL